MESLKDILQNRKSGAFEPIEIERLKKYVEKKHGFLPDISLSPRTITINAPTAAQASVLRLDWSNLNQLIDDTRKIYIKLKPGKTAKA